MGHRNKRALRIWDYVRNYRFRSVFFSYFLNIFIAILLTFILYASAVFIYYNYNLETRHQQDVLKKAEDTASAFDKSVNKIERDYFSLSISKNIAGFIGLREFSLKENTQLANAVNSELFDTVAYDGLIKSIYVYSFASGKTLASFLTTSEGTISDMDWYGYYENSPRKSFVYARRLYSNYMGEDTLTFGWEIDKYNKPAGLIVINCDMDAFSKSVTAGLSGDVTVNVISDYGGVFLSSDAGNINRDIADWPFLKNALDMLAKQPNDSVAIHNAGGVSALVRSKFSPYYVNLMEAVPAMSPGNLTVMILAAVISGIIFAALLALFISIRLYRHILSIVSLLNASYDYTAVKEPAEVGFIADNIINMTDKNKLFEHELAEKFTELKKSQSIALQMQINPHFLYNTLQMISLDVMEITKGDNNATIILESLSDILRRIIKTSNYIISLSDEIEITKKYVEIQKIRFKGGIAVEWKIDESFYKLRCVKFILQPVIENSLLHGVRGNGGIQIAVGASVNDNVLSIEIADNGQGIEPEKLKNLQEALNSVNFMEDDHIGLTNVNKRIKLIFNERFGVTVKSEYGHGTVVTISMPVS